MLSAGFVAQEEGWQLCTRGSKELEEWCGTQPQPLGGKPNLNPG